MDCLSPLLKFGATSASFHESGYKDVPGIFSKIILSGIRTESSNKISIWPDIRSEPEALLGFKFRTNETYIIPNIYLVNSFVGGEVECG